MGKKLIICAALTGTSTTREQAPSVPLTPDEIAQQAVAVVTAGASVLHIHVRDTEGRPTMDTEIFEETFFKVKKALRNAGLDAVLNLTTSGAYGGTASDAQRLGHLQRLKPEMCSFDANTMNWNCDIVFENSPVFLEKLCAVTMKEGVKPEIEIFDGGAMTNVNYYVKKGMLKTPCHYQFVLGVTGGLEGTAENIAFLKARLPEGATWSATGIGKAHIPVMLAALSMDCDGIRVGLEDNVYLYKGIKATNVQLVERAVEMARLAGRKIADAAEARKILKIGSEV